VAGYPVEAVSNAQAVQMIVRRALEGTPGAFVCLTNANNVVQSETLPTVREAADRSFLSIPDGYPLAWALRRRGYWWTQKLGGPDLLPMVAAEGRKAGIRHFFYGWTTRLSVATAQRLERQVPGTCVAGAMSPPFAGAQGFPDPPDSSEPVPLGTPLAPPWVELGGPVAKLDWHVEEVQAAIREVRPHILWVGLGSPVQEEWMSMLAGFLEVPVMIGVGRAFNYQSGMQRRCPPFMTRMGMEWAYTFLAEPRRLWKRYLIGLPRFAVLLAARGVKPAV
jgi:N-acetylglucosaminyldiphosphoundecaprenol N-acetyl-beta-D-mannosaminyltransferase